jgi:arsenite transporter
MTDNIIQCVVIFGFDSGAALATVVGVLVEVPVMLSVVKIVNSTRDWYEQKSAHGQILFYGKRNIQ